LLDQLGRKPVLTASFVLYGVAGVKRLHLNSLLPIFDGWAIKGSTI
jgi:hypothetical protein